MTFGLSAKGTDTHLGEIVAVYKVDGDLRRNSAGFATTARIDKRQLRQVASEASSGTNILYFLDAGRIRTMAKTRVYKGNKYMYRVFCKVS